MRLPPGLCPGPRWEAYSAPKPAAGEYWDTPAPPLSHIPGSATDIRRLDQFHMRCLRRITNIKWQDMIPNTEVPQRCAQNGIEHHIKRGQLLWFGQLVGMTDDQIIKALFYRELDVGHRTRRGQRRRFKDSLKTTLKSCGISDNTCEVTAMNCATPVYMTSKTRGVSLTYKSKLIVKIERRSIVLEAHASFALTYKYKQKNLQKIGFSEIEGGMRECPSPLHRPLGHRSITKIVESNCRTICSLL